MLFLTFGQPKSASTFLTWMVRRSCEIKGSDQLALQEKFLTGDYAKVRWYWPGKLSPLVDIAGQLGKNEHLTIKTHSAYSDKLDEAFASQTIVPFVSYRHIGDAALSCYDAGAKEREQGKSNEFASITTHREAIDFMRNHISKVTIPWLKKSTNNVFSYTDITQNPKKILNVLSPLLDISVETLLADSEMKKYLSGEKRVYNFNKGVSGRYQKLFSQEDLDYMAANYAQFIDFCEGKIGVDAL